MMHEPPLAIITGATGGIGRCVTLRLRRRGYRLALLGRDTDRLEELEAELAPHTGPGCTSVALDLADTDRLTFAITELLEQHGPAEVLVNNAGYNTYLPFAELPAAEHERVLQVNYHAPAIITHLVLPTMLRRGRGSIINVASIAAKMGPWGHSAYAASKAALIALTQSLAAEHEADGVHFSYVNPGIVATAYYDEPAMQRLWQSVRHHAIAPDRVARRIERLLDRPRLEVCVPRHYRVLDWLAAVSPALVHRVVSRQSNVSRAAQTRRPLDAGMETHTFPER